jgi:hypothetical protein
MNDDGFSFATLITDCLAVWSVACSTNFCTKRFIGTNHLRTHVMYVKRSRVSWIGTELAKDTSRLIFSQSQSMGCSSRLAMEAAGERCIRLTPIFTLENMHTSSPS